MKKKRLIEVTVFHDGRDVTAHPEEKYYAPPNFIPLTDEQKAALRTVCALMEPNRVKPQYGWVDYHLDRDEFYTIVGMRGRRQEDDEGHDTDRGMAGRSDLSG